ncbi:MAG: hypothetical protein WCE42_06440, partial [Rhizobium ruizarguesonis]
NSSVDCFKTRTGQSRPPQPNIPKYTYLKAPDRKTAGALLLLPNDVAMRDLTLGTAAANSATFRQLS